MRILRNHCKRDRSLWGINFLGKDLGRGLANSVFGRIESAFFNLISGLGVDPHSGLDRGMQVFDGERILYGHKGWFTTVFP